MKIMITGATGFVGRHLVPKLISKGYQLLELTIEPKLSETLYGNKTEKHVITDNQTILVKCIEVFNPEVVIHLASYLSASDDYVTLQKLLTTNIVFFCRLLDALKNTDIGLFVNTGTFAEYCKGDEVLDPAYLYSATKTASRSFLDYYSKAYEFKQSTVIPYTIYGGQDTQKKIIDIMFNSVSSQVPIDLSPGEQVLDFIHVDDVADFYAMLIEKKEELPAISNLHLGTGKGHTLRELACIIEKVTGHRPNINWGGKQYRPTDVMYAVANTKWIIENLNWQPSEQLEQGIHSLYHSKRTI